MGNGKSTWFWHDNWSPLGNLLNHIGEEGPRELRIRRDAKVSDACNREGWQLASPMSDSALSLHIYLSALSPVSISTEEDCFEWIVDDKPCEGFSASKTWEVLRERDSEKTWAELVWFKGCTRKHAFHMWISNLDRLPTRSKLAAWGIQVSSTCCLCNGALETRDHLFLHCGFSKEIWDKVMQRIDLQPMIFDDWESMMAWGKITSIRQPQTLRLLLMHAVVYNIWRQRNNLIHNEVTIPPPLIFKDIDRQIINSITARRTMKRFRKLMQLWLR